MSALSRIRGYVDRQGAPPNAFVGLSKANNVAQLDVLRQNAQVQHAAHVRLMSKMLGVPPTPMEEDLLAGGDIKIGSNAGPWILAAVALVIGAILLWPFLPKPTTTATTAQGVQLPGALQWNAAQ